MRRALLLAAALAIPVSRGATMALSGQAGAARSIACTAVTGSITGTVTLGGCTGGVTGGHSLPMSAVTLALGGTVTWASGSTTTIAKPTLTPTSAKKCADPTGSAENVSTAVTADKGDGIKVPGKAKGAVCIAKSGALSDLKPMKIK